MLYKSRFQIPIPEVDLSTYLFKHPTGPISDKPQFIDSRAPDERYLSMQSYRLWSKRLAVGLQKAGLKPGDRVLLFSGNTIFFPVVLMGTIMAQGIFTGANPGYVARELAYQLRDSGAAFIICAEASVPTVLDATKEVGFPKDHILVFDDGIATYEGRGKDVGDLRHWTKLLASEQEVQNWAWKPITTISELENTTVCLNYSSGTTGNPKGVQITHRNYVSNCEGANYLLKLDKKFEERRGSRRELLFLPMYHAMAQTLFVVSAPLVESQVFIMPKFEFEPMLANIQRFKITSLSLVPPIVLAMAKSPLTKKYDLSSVNKAGCGAAPLGMELTKEFEKLWPNGQVNVKQGWGMTEATCTATNWDPNKVSKSFSVGELAPNLEARLVDLESNDVPKGERGEIWIKGPTIMKGYWNKPKETKETFADGFLRTGDIAEIDDEGKVFIVDRIKELIKVQGNQVAPAELEALLLEHQDVADAAVIGIKINDDEHPRAYVILQEGSKASEKDIADYLASKVSKTKRLTGGVKFTKDIPKNPSGKILRKILRERAAKEIGDSGSKASKL